MFMVDPSPWLRSSRRDQKLIIKKLDLLVGVGEYPIDMLDTNIIPVNKYSTTDSNLSLC